MKFYNNNGNFVTELLPQDMTVFKIRITANGKIEKLYGGFMSYIEVNEIVCATWVM